MTAAVPPPGDGPLEAVRAVELGQLIAGPQVGTLLGDFGADPSFRERGLLETAEDEVRGASPSSGHEGTA